MNYKYLFLDIDGTVVTTKSGKTFREDYHDIKLIDGVKQKVQDNINNGVEYIFGISNQAGCEAVDEVTGKPYKTVCSAILEFQQVIQLLPQLDIIYFCPNFAGTKCIKVLPGILNTIEYDNSDKIELVPFGIDGKEVEGFNRVLDKADNFRKPSYGMLTLAASEIDVISLNKENSLMIGDREEDMECAKNAGISFSWINNWLKE